MKRSGRLIASLGSLLLVATCLTARADSAPTAEPTEWVRHDLLVDLRDLPKRYTCNELWYRFRDVLVTIGARPVKVLPYRCESALGSGGRSPRVHLTFDMPQALPGPHGTGESAVLETLHVAAGNPQSLGRDDCDLLRQIKDTLFASLHLHVVDYSLQCRAPANARPRFGVSVQALIVGASPPLHAAAEAKPTSDR